MASNSSPGSEEDLGLILETILPRGAAYLYRYGSPGTVATTCCQPS